jgi:hypothetical protein
VSTERTEDLISDQRASASFRQTHVQYKMEGDEDPFRLPNKWLGPEASKRALWSFCY